MPYTMSEKALNQRKSVIKKAQAASLIINKLPQYKIDDIIKLRNEGFSQEKISYLLKVARNTVIKYYRLGGLK